MTLTRRTAVALLAAAALPWRARAAVAQDGRRVEEVLRLDRRPGNPALTADGRLIFSMHPFDTPDFRLMERRADGKVVPFPDPGLSRTGFANVIGLRAAENGVLWILDLGGGGLPPKLVGWNLRRNALERAIPLGEGVTRPNSFLQDFALDQRRGMAYIADATFGRPINPAIVAVDLRRGTARRLLEDHPSFLPEPDVRIVAEGRIARERGLDGSVAPVRLALDPITIDPAYEWVYFGPSSGFGLYRVRARDLADARLVPAALARRIERFGRKRPCDGISIDREGNVYVTDVARNGIGVVTRQGYRLLASDPRLVWPDGLAFGPDGMLYVTANQLNRSAQLNAGRERGRPPYHILRVRPLSPSAIGR